MKFIKTFFGKKDSDVGINIPTSILIGSVIISLSIIFSSWQSPNTKSDNTKSVGNQNNPENTRTLIAKVAERKDAPIQGGGKKLEIVEFSDFQCPFCQSFFLGAYREIKRDYIDTGKAKFVFRHFPLEIHNNAMQAAEAAECANLQGKFFEYHDVLFQKMSPDGKGLEIENLKKYAGDVGLDTAKFNKCLDNKETSFSVKKDVEDGKNAGVSGTPTVFINGEKIVGAKSYQEFKTVIEKYLE